MQLSERGTAVDQDFQRFNPVFSAVPVATLTSVLLRAAVEPIIPEVAER